MVRLWKWAEANCGEDKMWRGVDHIHSFNFLGKHWQRLHYVHNISIKGDIVFKGNLVAKVQYKRLRFDLSLICSQFVFILFLSLSLSFFFFFFIIKVRKHLSHFAERMTLANPNYYDDRKWGMKALAWIMIRVMWCWRLFYRFPTWFLSMTAFSSSALFSAEIFKISKSFFPKFYSCFCLLLSHIETTYSKFGHGAKPSHSHFPNWENSSHMIIFHNRFTYECLFMVMPTIFSLTLNRVLGYFFSNAREWISITMVVFWIRCQMMGGLTQTPPLQETTINLGFGLGIRL